MTLADNHASAACYGLVINFGAFMHALFFLIVFCRDLTLPMLFSDYFFNGGYHDMWSLVSQSGY